MPTVALERDKMAKNFFLDLPLFQPTVFVKMFGIRWVILNSDAIAYSSLWQITKKGFIKMFTFITRALFVFSKKF